mmetsp:Transcript_6137/g.8929  ORF Transcript_6137/g.8929 Transcript_6137/m.8929 type:complete len:575 (+) Transcript_6137:78-1802(+)
MTRIGSKKSSKRSMNSSNGRGSTTTPKSGGGEGEGFKGNFNMLSSQSLSSQPSFFMKKSDQPIDVFSVAMEDKILEIELEVISEMPSFEWKITVPLPIQDNPDILKVFMGTIKSFQFTEIIKNRHLPGWKPRDLYEHVKQCLKDDKIKCYFTTKVRNLIVKATKGRSVPKTTKDRLVVYLDDDENKNLFLMLYYKEKQISKRELQLGFRNLDEHTRIATRSIEESHDKLKRVIVKMHDRVTNNLSQINQLSGHNLSQDNTLTVLKTSMNQMEKLVDKVNASHETMSKKLTQQEQEITTLKNLVSKLEKNTAHFNKPHRVYHHQIEWQVRAVDFVKHKKLVSDAFAVPETHSTFNLHLLPNGYENEKISVDDRYMCICINPLSIKLDKQQFSHIEMDYSLIFEHPPDHHRHTTPIPDEEREPMEFTAVDGSFHIPLNTSNPRGQGVPICMRSKFLNYLESNQTYHMLIKMHIRSTLHVPPSTLKTRVAQKLNSPPKATHSSASMRSTTSTKTHTKKKKTPIIKRVPKSKYNSTQPSTTTHQLAQLTPAAPVSKKRGDHDGGGSSMEGESPRNETF